MEAGVAMSIHGLLLVLSGLLMAPLLNGVITKTKAAFAGRKGAPLLQQYHDLARLLRKGEVLSGTTTWVFRVAPSISLVTTVSALLLVAPAGAGTGWGFSGDLVFLFCLFGVSRLFTVAAALDTGSSFEGMGASRELLYSALSEPALLIGFGVLVRVAGGMSLEGIYDGLGENEWLSAGTALSLVAVSFFLVMLAENSRIPFDDPNTHLELTMVHEVMVLDSSGPDFAMITYGASLKLWVFASLVVNLLLTTVATQGFPYIALSLAGVFLIGLLVGVVESVMARLSLTRTPHLLAGAGALSVLSFILTSRFLQ